MRHQDDNQASGIKWFGREEEKTVLLSLQFNAEFNAGTTPHLSRLSPTFFLIYFQLQLKLVLVPNFHQ